MRTSFGQVSCNNSNADELYSGGIQFISHTQNFPVPDT